LDKAKKRVHILDGLLIALDNLDAVIKTIRESADADEAKTNLMERFKLSDVQAQAILDLQLRRLAALERQKIEDEHREVKERIAFLEDLLAHPKKILGLIREDLNEVAGKYGDDRRTRISPDADSDLSDEALVQDEPVFVSITQRGYVKRVSDKTYRSQSRGGRGVLGQSMREEDEVAFFLRCNTLGTILFFSDRGKVYSERVYQIPDESRQGRGIPLVNIISLDPDERVTAVVPVPDFRKAEYCTLATRQGKMKRVALSEFASVRPSGLVAIKIEEGDHLGWVCLTSGKDEIILVTRDGNALRFDENEIRVMGRTAVGVRGIRFRENDYLAGMEVVEPNGFLLVLSERGFGKRTSLSEYTAKSRGGLGVASINKDAVNKIGHIVIARVVQEKDEITLISSGGIVLRLKVDNISVQGRSTRGVTLMNLEKDDTVAAVARILEI
jgi:DNA gyrase subunit A